MCDKQRWLCKQTQPGIGMQLGEHQKDNLGKLPILPGSSRQGCLLCKCQGVGDIRACVSQNQGGMGCDDVKASVGDGECRQRRAQMDRTPISVPAVLVQVRLRPKVPASLIAPLSTSRAGWLETCSSNPNTDTPRPGGCAARGPGMCGVSG